MLNLICRNRTWYFNRRVPSEFKEFDSRNFIRISLKTQCKKEAIKRAIAESDRLQEYWQQLMNTGQKHSHDNYAQAVKRAAILGFPYLPKDQIAIGNIDDLVNRLIFVVKNGINEKQAQAVLGTVPEPEIFLAELLPKFWELKKEVRLDKSDRQYRKWENPRVLAFNNFLNVVGNKSVQQLNRQDFDKFKDWWVGRIASKKLSKRTANKSMIYVKNIIETVCDNINIKIDKKHLFNKLLFKGTQKARLPFTTDHILNVLLKEENLKGLSDHYRKMIWVFAETGIHIDEQVGILPSNIFLDHAIPHVVITSHEKDKLKTIHRERIIPLVGFALDAFRAYPNGFSSIVTNTDSASTAIGKYLREHKLYPSDRHSLYSLRHSFQDRLTNLDCPDRIQTDLMGHAFKGRTKYGVGASLEHSLTWMKRIQLKQEQVENK